MHPEITKKSTLFFQHGTPRKYKKGEILLRADDPPQGLFLLLKGYVRQYTISSQGNEFTLQIIHPFTYFPLSWILSDIPNTYYFEALTSVEVVRIPPKQARNEIEAYPDTYSPIIKKQVAEYEEIIERMEQIIFSDSYRKVISVLLYLCKHFGSIKRKEIIIKQRFTHHAIATLVGIARETVSVEMTKLKKKKYIRVRKGIISVIQLSQLKQELL